MSSSSAATTWREPTKTDKPHKDADLNTTWPFLRDGVEHIMTRLNLGMSYSYYILLYTAIYDFCVQARPSSGYMNRGGASLQGAELYTALKGYLSEHCRDLRAEAESMTDIDLLKFYAKSWDRYTTGATYVNKLFNYLNKHWVKREKDEGRKEIYSVYTLALVSWKTEFFRSFTHAGSQHSNRLTQALLRQIERQRDGEIIDNGLIKKVINSYVSLGLDESDSSRQMLDVYKEHFQLPFIQATVDYYKAESASFLASNSVSDYMKKAEARLQEESDRVSHYLHDSSRKELKERCEEVLIGDHSNVITDEFQALLNVDKVEDLSRMYGLLMRIPNGLEPLRSKFTEHVKRAGQDAVQKVVPAPGATTEDGKAATLDPKSYIEALLEVHKKYSEVVNGPFRAEVGFNASLDKACSDFVNTNAVATTPTRSPDLLAAYCDQLLRKGNKDLDADALEAALNQAMVIFSFIDDKDVFQKFYQKKLAQRLINSNSVSDDSESSMITKLKEACGYEFTSKLTRMFQDINISREQMETFKGKEREAGHDSGIDPNIVVLGTVNWPLNAPQTDYTVPKDVLPVHNRFLGAYANQHSGRKLTWMWHVSKAEIRTTYLQQKYIFMVSAYQYAILSQFNDSDQVEFKEVLDGTGLAENILKPQLALLVKAKVLLQDGDSYELNLNFKSKKIRVNLNQPIRAEQKAEQADVLQSVDEDRRFVYQATIVRLMKARKTMKHQALIQEVTAQISTKFTPKVPEIKKAIEHLISKEYLERDAENRDTYRYLA